MKKLSILVIALFVIITSGFTVSILWNIANEGVTVNFELPDEGTKGTLSGLRGIINFDQNHPGESRIIASIDINTLNTGNEQKDKHLLSSDFFNAEKYPNVSFSSSSIKVTKDGFIATGNLTIKDSTKTIEIPFTFAEDATGGGIFKGTMTVHSGDFGVTKPSKDGKDKVVITLNVPVKK